MLDFSSDYTRPGHPLLVDAIAKNQGTQFLPYGTDPVSSRAKARIREACRAPKAGVHFLLGGTQTNQLTIDALLRSFEGVIAADTGHVSAHEAGAIEHGGHKVLTIPHQNGKLTADAVANYCEAFYADENHTHMVFPGMVYLSQPTEYGTLYFREELRALRRVCDRYSLRLYVDGARLAYALGAKENDVSLADLAAVCDAFYIGGTKCGALFGEALVVPDPSRTPQLFTVIKQHGALLAKGALLGLQFDALFAGGLYLSVGQSAVAFASQIRRALTEKGYNQPLLSETNQIFLTLPDAALEALKQQVRVSFWEKADAGHTVVRIATDWATTQEDVDALLALFEGAAK